jgi:hypothetical protein
MAEETIVLRIDDAEINDAVAKMDDALDKKEEVRGMRRLSYEILRTIPGLSYARTLMMQIEAMMRMSPEIALLIVAAKTLHLFLDQARHQEEQAKAYEKFIRSYRRQVAP